ncbi:MAG: TatD family hydrolase [Desulfovibrionaceae bacterium]
MKKKPFPNLDDFIVPQLGCDSHAHLYPEYYEDSLNTIVEYAHTVGIANIITIFLNIEQYKKEKYLFDTIPSVFFSIGIHPHDALTYTDALHEELYAILSADSRCKAVGEAGLDYFGEFLPKEIQEHAFTAQISLAKRCSLPLIIHSRDAFDDTISLLEQHSMQNHPVVWHCYSGNATIAEYIIKQGWHISFSGNVSYPSAKEIRQAIHVVPLDKMLIETDSPYLSPQAKRGQKNQPAYILYTADTIAQELRMPLKDIWTKTGENARNLFSLPSLT